MIRGIEWPSAKSYDDGIRYSRLRVNITSKLNIIPLKAGSRNVCDISSDKHGMSAMNEEYPS